MTKNIRDIYHLHTGDKIEFVFEREGEVIVRPVKKTVDDVFGKPCKPDQMPLSIEEMNEAIGNV
jgi:bifunctional DNA-binding transcriptional regulator/antitoxin component of YhaV-PrlF toxin-antitoxin module